jgi:hypothetical protein
MSRVSCCSESLRFVIVTANFRLLGLTVNQSCTCHISQLILRRSILILSSKLRLCVSRDHAYAYAITPPPTVGAKYPTLSIIIKFNIIKNR